MKSGGYKLSGRERKEIAKEYSSGMSIAETARKYGVTEPTVRYWAKKYGMTRPKRKEYVLTDAQIEDGKRHYLGGESMAVSARACGTTEHLLKKALVEEGVPIRGRKFISPEDREKAEALLRSGMRTADVAKECSMSIQSASVILAGLHIDRRRRLSPAQMEEIMPRWQAGETQRVLAEEYGVSPGTMNRAIREMLNGEKYEKEKDV